MFVRIVLQVKTSLLVDEERAEKSLAYNIDTMLPKKKRIDRKTFLAVLPKTKTESTPFFTIRSKKSDTPKVSIVISKKIAKTAIQRNYIKRRIYNHLSKQLSTKTLLIFVKKPLENKDILKKALLELDKIVS